MKDDETVRPTNTRRAFLSRVGTAGSTVGLAGIAGCSALPFGDDSPDPPDYDRATVSQLLDRGFPEEPAVFPVEIPPARFESHETVARERLDAVPASPDLPNEALAEQLAHERERAAGALAEAEDASTPLERLGDRRSDRIRATEVWAAYQIATGEYTASRFEDRYDRLRVAYNDFRDEWTYQGRDPATAVVVHRYLENLVTRGRESVLNTGPFPAVPKADVMAGARMVRSHEVAEAGLADARVIRSEYLHDQTAASSFRLVFADAAKQLQHSLRRRRASIYYRTVIEHGAEALSVDLGQGPSREAFRSARRHVLRGGDEIRRALEQTDPATAIAEAARYRAGLVTFERVVDALEAEEIGWPADEAALRELHAETEAAIQTAWRTEPRQLSVDVATNPTDMFRHLDPRGHEGEIDGETLVRYVGRLHYVNRFAGTVPETVAMVVDALRRN